MHTNVVIVDTGLAAVRGRFGADFLDPATARDFLFRLYASSKENDPDAIGHFGVGFWAVLLWDPEVITVTSNDGSGAWLVRLDLSSGRVDWQSAPATARGTTIVLERPSAVLIGWRERLRHVGGGRLTSSQ